ncbi:hypothetical protein D3C85_1316940 [compost metagenome]
MPQVEVYPLPFAAEQLKPVSAHRKQARCAGAENRVERCEISVLQYRIADPCLNTPTDLRIVVLRSTIRANG